MLWIQHCLDTLSTWKWHHSPPQGPPPLPATTHQDRAAAAKGVSWGGVSDNTVYIDLHMMGTSR